MELLIPTLVVIAVSCCVLFGAFTFLKRQASSSVGAENESYLAKIREQIAEIKNLLTYSGGYASKGQFNNIAGQLEKAKQELETERNALKEVEPKLDEAQKNVELKESQQQEVKSAKDEEELQLKNLLETFTVQSAESASLEQELANSMKNLDAIMAEAQLTENQRAVLDELSRTMSNTGGTLRDLLTDYETLNERLTNLQVQLNDLEEEYTKLVEKQLGE